MRSIIRYPGRLFTVLVLGVIFVSCFSPPSSIDDPGPPDRTIRTEGDIEFSGEVTLDAGTNLLSTTIRATNNGMENAGIEYGPCSFRLMAYAFSKDEGKGDLVWYNRLPENYICHDVLHIVDISPGESAQLENLGNVNGNRWAFDLPDGQLKIEMVAKKDSGMIISQQLSVRRIK